MHFKSYFAASFLAFGLRATADSWTNPDGGNTHVEIKDSKVLYGSQPPWYALDAIKDNCLSNGCSGGEPVTWDTTLIMEGQSVDATITMTVDGSFNDPGESGNLNDLVEVAKSVVAHSGYDFEKGVSYVNPGVCSGISLCEPSDSGKLDQYTATDVIIIRVEDDDGGQLADMSISVSVDAADADSGACSAAMASAGAIAGAVNGIAGGFFALLGLGCT